MLLQQLLIHVEKSTCTRLNSRIIKGLNGKNKTFEHLEENIKCIWNRERFLESQKGQILKEKIDIFNIKV